MAAAVCLGSLSGCVLDDPELDSIEQHIPLPPPGNLMVEVISETGVTLTWDPSPGATKYIVMRGSTPETIANFTSVAVTRTSWTYNHLEENTDYCWAVRNLNATREVSAPSNIVCINTGTAPVPPPPANVTATATSSSRIRVTWDPVAGATSYQIFGSVVGQPLVLVGSVNSSLTTFTHTGLQPNTTYGYRVKALTSAGDTELSDPLATATTFAFGLELYWKLDEQGGGSALDQSGFGRTGTLSGGAVYSTDRPPVLDDRSSVLLPAGTTSAITVPNTAAFNLGGPFTVALWVKATAAGDLKIMGMRSPGCGGLGWEIAQNAANGLHFAGETGGMRTFGTSLTVGEWTHVAVTGDGTTMTLYLNGQSVGAFAGGVGNHLTQPLTVGHIAGCAGGEIIVDEVQVLSRVMTPAEVAAIGDTPDAPVNLAITNITSTRMDLEWTAVPPPVTKYLLFRGVGGAAPVFFTSTPPDRNTYAYGHLTPDTEYSWQVAVVVGQLISQRSNLVSGRTLGPPPAPTNVTATAISSSRIRVDWAAVPGAVRYYIYQSVNGGPFGAVGTTTTALTFTSANLASMTTYTYYVIAVDAGNVQSQPSVQASATTL